MFLRPLFLTSVIDFEVIYTGCGGYLIPDMRALIKTQTKTGKKRPSATIYSNPHKVDSFEGRYSLVIADCVVSFFAVE